MRLIDCPDVLVIGAGLAGLAAAHALAGDGAQVLVLERDLVARHASGLNAGGVRRVNRHRAEMPLADAALALWPRLSDRLGSDVGFHAVGHLLLAEDAPEFARLEALAADGSPDVRLLDAAATRALAPSLAAHVAGALWRPDDGYADPAATCAAYRRACEALSVTVLEGVTLHALDRQGDRWAAITSAGDIATSAVVNCAGAWGGAVAAMVGETIPIEARAPIAMLVGPRARFLTPVVQTLTRRLTLKQLPCGRTAIGGGHRARLAADGAPALVTAEAEANLATAASLFPSHLATARAARVWAGIEGYTADGIAVVGASGAAPGVFHAFGFSGHGFALMPAIGPCLAALVAGRSPGIAIEDLAPTRFMRGIDRMPGGSRA